VTIFFRKSEEGMVVTYNPMTISGFLVHNEIYTSGIVAAETSVTQVNQLSSEPKINTRIDTVFLQTMFQGSKNLYYYSDKSGKQNFYIRQWPDFELLVYKKYLGQDKQSSVSAGAVNQIRENKTFIGQLSLYFQDCPSMQSKINAATYDKRSLEGLFKSYYECSKVNLSYQYVKEKPKTYFGVIAGMSITNLKLKSSEDPWQYIANVDYSTSYNFTGGLSLEYILPRNQRKWSVYNEIMFSSYSVSSYNENYKSENVYDYYTTKFAYTYLKMNNMIRFTYPVNTFFVFVNAGLSNGYVLSETNSLIKESKFYTDPVTTEGPAIKGSKKWEYGILAGAGIKYSKFSFETRYEGGSGMSDLPALISIANRLFFMVGYRF
jgi:hypothetical protein